MDEKERLIQQLDEAHAQMCALLDEIDRYIIIYPGWTIRQVLAHITGWDDAAATSLRAHATGIDPGAPAARGINWYNAQSVAERETLSFEHTVKEWELARENFKAAIREMPADRIVKSRPEVSQSCAATLSHPWSPELSHA